VGEVTWFETNWERNYADINGDSGVASFEVNDESITVWFKGMQRSYTYSHDSAGQHHVDRMIQLALSGDGLNSYINHHAKFDYVQ